MGVYPVTAFSRGDIASYWYDTGAFGMKTLLGVVIKAGPKSFTVRWESGICNTLRREEPKNVKLVTDPELLETLHPDMLAESKRLKGTS